MFASLILVPHALFITFDESIRDDGVAGVGRVNTVEGDQAAEESCGQNFAVGFLA